MMLYTCSKEPMVEGGSSIISPVSRPSTPVVYIPIGICGIPIFPRWNLQVRLRESRKDFGSTRNGQRDPKSLIPLRFFGHLRESRWDFAPTRSHLRDFSKCLPVGLDRNRCYLLLIWRLELAEGISRIRWLASHYRYSPTRYFGISSPVHKDDHRFRP